MDCYGGYRTLVFIIWNEGESAPMRSNGNSSTGFRVVIPLRSEANDLPYEVQIIVPYSCPLFHVLGKYYVFHLCASDPEYSTEAGAE